MSPICRNPRDCKNMWTVFQSRTVIRTNIFRIEAVPGLCQNPSIDHIGQTRMALLAQAIRYLVRGEGIDLRMVVKLFESDFIASPPNNTKGRDHRWRKYLLHHC